MELGTAEPPSSLVRRTHLQDLVYPTMDVALSRILDLGIEAAPEEACGIIVNETGAVRVVQMHNRAEKPGDSYRIDPVTIRSLHLRPHVWAHVAVWHTHPGGNVGPSPGDLAAKVEGVKYIVVTVPTGEAVQF